MGRNLVGRAISVPVSVVCLYLRDGAHCLRHGFSHDRLSKLCCHSGYESDKWAIRLSV